MHLHVDRPARVHRTGDGRWAWTCWCCPPPLAWTTSYADSWALAMDDADTHVRHQHPAARVEELITVRGWAA